MKNDTKDEDHSGGAAPAPAVRKPRRRQAVDDTVQLAIGSNLKAVYAEVLSQPIPDKFLELLGKLEAGRKEEA